MDKALWIAAMILVICGYTEAAARPTWTGWSGNNWFWGTNKEAHCKTYGNHKVVEMNWKEQDGYGLVDLWFRCSSGETFTLTKHKGGSRHYWGSSQKCSSGFEKLSPRERNGFGLINMRTQCGDKNMDSNSKYRGHWNRMVHCTRGKQIVGFTVKELNGYGLIDVRVMCRRTTRTKLVIRLEMFTV